MRNPQRSLLAISNARSGESVDAIAAYVLNMANGEKDTFPEVEEVLIVSKSETRRIKRKSQ